MSDLIYLRKAGHKYNMENGFSRPDGYGGRIVKQGIMIEFQPISEINQTGRYNVTQAATKFVDFEIVAGNVERDNREKEITRRVEQISRFIENHDHFTKPDGRGQNLIWREPTDEEKAEALLREAEALKEKAEAITKAATVEEGEEKLEELKEELAPKPKKELSKPVGVVTGPSSAAKGGRA